MKVLVLMGSPRKKDGYNVCRQIEEEMNKSGFLEFEYVHLKDLYIEDCRGCEQCFQKGEACCPIRDDIGMLRQKLANADGIIFVTPVYACQITGLLKRAIDRLAFLFHRPELVGKPALVVVTTAGGGMKETTQYLKMTACGWGCNLVDNVQVISSFYFNKPGDNNYYDNNYFNETNKSIKKASNKLLEAIQQKKMPVPSFYQLYMFHGLKSKTFTSKADYDYWKSKGWLDAPYYYETKLGPLKKFFGFALDKFIKHMMESYMKKYGERHNAGLAKS